MMKLSFTSVDRILSKLSRELKNTELQETDVIEWVGEAMEHLKVVGTQEESVAFIEVKDYHADVPCGFQALLQMARNNHYTSEIENPVCIDEVLPEVTESCTNCDENPANAAGYPVPLDCQGRIIGDYEVAYYRPFFDLKWEFQPFVNSSIYQERFTPVRLANHTFFNSLVCKEKDQSVYSGCIDEYTIVGVTEKKFRTSFKEGQIAVSYLKTVVDPETGYPLIPDDISFITAITYYVKWKIAEGYAWQGRNNFSGLEKDSEAKWFRYVKQARNKLKMPTTIDQYQNLLESHRLIPNHRRYYGYFGNLGRAENRSFNQPERHY